MAGEPSTPAADEPTGAAQADPLAEDLYCPGCDYNLRGLTGERCPECGHELDWARLRTSQIPWVDRGQHGALRAYWRTVWWVTFRRKRLGNEIARPVSFVESQKFRWLTILHGWLAFLAAVGGWYLLWPTTRFKRQVLEAGAWLPVVLSVCLLLALAALTGLPGYFFHPKNLPVARQNRAVALSYYTCGSLAWLLLAVVFYLVSLAMRPLSEEVGLLFMGLAYMLPVAVLAKWWLDLVYLTKRTLRRSPTGLRLFTFGLPALGLLVGGLILLGLPLAVLYVAVFFVSLGWS